MNGPGPAAALPAALPMAAAIPEIRYRIGSPALGHFPGAHRSLHGDTGLEYAGQARLIDLPDARRLDLHASLRDPFGEWVVKRHRERKSIPVVAVADLSASMGFEGARRKLDVLADLVASLGWSAWRSGDRFGFVGCDAAVAPGLLLPPTRHRGAAQSLAGRLREWPLTGTSAAGLAEAHAHIGRQRALVFVVSDFHLPLAAVEVLLASLARHDVVPVVLWDAAEFGLDVPHGLAQVIEPETGVRRAVWWRPALRARWQAAHAERRAALDALFSAHRLKPLYIEGAFDAEAVTRHFHA